MATTKRKKTTRRRSTTRSFSWKRILGITALKRRFTRETGIPTTQAGFERKIGQFLLYFLFGWLIGKKDKKKNEKETEK